MLDIDQRPAGLTHPVACKPDKSSPTHVIHHNRYINGRFCAINCANMLTQRCQASVLQDRRYRPAATTPSHARRFSSSLVPRATPEESGGGGPFEGLINSLTVALKNSPINEVSPTAR